MRGGDLSRDLDVRAATALLQPHVGVAKRRSNHGHSRGRLVLRDAASGQLAQCEAYESTGRYTSTIPRRALAPLLIVPSILFLIEAWLLIISAGRCCRRQFRCRGAGSRSAQVWIERLAAVAVLVLFCVIPFLVLLPSSFLRSGSSRIASGSAPSSRWAFNLKIGLRVAAFVFDVTPEALR